MYNAAAIFAGGVPYMMPLTHEHGFLPNLDEIPGDVLDKTVLMYLNYPNNPTGAVAPVAFYEKCVALAKKHDFIICSDAPTRRRTSTIMTGRTPSWRCPGRRTSASRCTR